MQAISNQVLQTSVEQLLELSQHAPTLQVGQSTTAKQPHFNVSRVQASLGKAIAPTFEIVFAGAFSAGKSMLINALLERELLYSAEGHATGTECQITYAEPDQERVVLTFLSEAELFEQADALRRRLGFLNITLRLDSHEIIQELRLLCDRVIQQEGGASKSERAKQAHALDLLLQGLTENRQYIEPETNKTMSMEQFNFANLQEAASYARRGSNSAVLKRVEYYCHHELLRDGNVLIDTPGIDAPVKADADLTYRKIADPDTSAVICVLKPASAGDMTSEETELLERTRANPGIRDRVFYVFNRIDETWYNTQLRQRLDLLIRDQFRDSDRVYKTSGLLGFYGSQIQQTGMDDSYGLNSLFATGVNEPAETPQFVSEFNRYCASSGKLPVDRFRIQVNSYESPNENYVRILNEQGTPLIEQLIQDSGIQEFRTAVTRYLTEEKRPLLLANLADDLQPLCAHLRNLYLQQWHHLRNQPQDAEAIKTQELQQLSKTLMQIGKRCRQHIESEVNAAIASNSNEQLESDFRKLKARLISRLDELLNTFSVGSVHQRAQASHRRNSVVPLLGILAEAFYYLANGLEAVLVEAMQELTTNFFEQLMAQIRQQHYYCDLLRLLGHDGGIEQSLKQLQEQVALALTNEAQTECDRYVRERPEFFAEGSASVFQLRQTLQQACRGYDYQTMVEAEPAIRQLLMLDFGQKVKDSVTKTLRQTINQTLNTHLLDHAAQQADCILQQYDDAQSFYAKTLEQEAKEHIRQNQQLQAEVEHNIAGYNQAIAGINQCLIEMQLHHKQLPSIRDSELAIMPVIDGLSTAIAEPLEEKALLSSATNA